MVDPRVVIEKIVVYTRDKKATYLGEPESAIIKGLTKKNSHSEYMDEIIHIF